MLPKIDDRHLKMPVKYISLKMLGVLGKHLFVMESKAGLPNYVPALALQLPSGAFLGTRSELPELGLINKIWGFKRNLQQHNTASS